MTYKEICKGFFISRPNRFISEVNVNGEKMICHVKNTGRCRELLTSGASVILSMEDNPNRKTKADLVAVWKGERLINMDSSAPNTVFGEWLKKGGLGFVPDYVKAECTHGDSRFDFYFEHEGVKAFAEIKGVTLESDGVVLFPDAKTLRGTKHMHGLKEAVKEGYEAYAVFVIQMSDVKYFTPNKAMDMDFANALIKAKEGGVKIKALSCNVYENGLEILGEVPIKL